MYELFMDQFKIDRKYPDLEHTWGLIYSAFKRSPELKIQAIHNTNFLNGSWFDPTIETNLDDTATNPKVSELCKYYVMYKLC